jgi:hypothetical protein
MSRLTAFAELHASANSSGSRGAFGESCFSASSRWHASTSLSASRRFAFASARVSPCEMAAGTSSTKQVYPPSLAGSKTPSEFQGEKLPRCVPIGNSINRRLGTNPKSHDRFADSVPFNIRLSHECCSHVPVRHSESVRWRIGTLHLRSRTFRTAHSAVATGRADL